jgi:exosortase
MTQAPPLSETPTASPPREAAPVPGTGRLGRADFLKASAASLLAIGVTFDAWISIFALGTMKEELSYVFLAPILIAWTAWERRARWVACAPRNGWLGLLVLCGGWWLSSYGFLADPVLWRAGAVVTAAGAFLAVAGTDVLVRFLPAVVACGFLIPVYPNGRYQIAAPLQVATAQAAQTVCDLLGIYVDRSGNLLSINGVGVNVAEGCNGMRMILTLFLVCYLVAFTSSLRTPLRVLVLVASPVVAIIANVSRLVPTIWMFGHVSAEEAERFHDAAGWVMTVVSFLVLMGGCRLLQRVLYGPDAPAGTGTLVVKGGRRHEV